MMIKTLRILMNIKVAEGVRLLIHNHPRLPSAILVKPSISSTERALSRLSTPSTATAFEARRAITARKHLLSEPSVLIHLRGFLPRSKRKILLHTIS